MALRVRRLSTQDPNFKTDFKALLEWSVREDQAVVERVKEVLEAVKVRGDAAVVELTQELDRNLAKCARDLEIVPAAMEAAWERLPEGDRESLRYAADRVRAYHEKQIQASFEHEDELGNKLGTRFTSLRRVGVYVPGGRAAYPSTVLMTVIPAQVAKVGEIVVTVPAIDGEIDDTILAALHLVGIQQAFAVGGAQAIGALAFGTETIPRVDKVVGPGGAWVAAAKKLVFGPVGIESLAGPSEVLIVGDGSVEPQWVAWDLLSQAEHDEHAQAILISPSTTYIDSVASCLEHQLAASPRRAIAQESLETRGALIHSCDLDEAVVLSNEVAPEHMQLAVQEPRNYLAQVEHTGAVFLGAYSGEVLGDYVAGPSHVLPTFGTARYASVLSVQDFMKRTSVIEISEHGAQTLGRVAGNLADMEGLYAHAQAARIRVKDYDHNL